MLAYHNLTLAQKFLYHAHTEYQIIDGGRGTRKTTACVVKIHDTMWMFPGSLILVFGQTLKHIEITFLKRWADVVHHSAWKFNGNAKKIEMPECRGEIYLLGADHPESINRVLGSSVTGFYLLQAELFKSEKLFNDLNACVRLYGSTHPSHLRLMDTNPGSPSHFIHRRFIDFNDEHYAGINMNQVYNDHGICVMEGDNLTHISIETNSYTSVYSTQRIEQERQTMDDVSFKRMYGGKWVGIEGVVYKDFIRSTHVKKFEAEPNWQYYLGIDFGYTNPFAAILIGVDNDSNVWIVDEYYVAKRLTPDHAEHLKERYIQNYQIKAMVCDPSAPGQRMELERSMRIRSLIANNDVDSGLKTVMRLLLVQGNGEPRFKIHPRCKNTIREMEAYQWDTKRSGEEKETPLKKDDHCPDAIRYVCHTLKHLLFSKG